MGMTSILFRTDPGTYPSWDIYCWPAPYANKLLVRFCKRSKQRKMLDQVAAWNGAWDLYRWVPHSPTVPRFLIEKVKQQLREMMP